MADKHFSLAATAHNVAVRLLKVTNEAGQNHNKIGHGGWQIWEEILGIEPANPEFIKRILFIQEDLVRLRKQIEIEQISPQTRNLWISALNKLISTTEIRDFHHTPTAWRNRVKDTDVAALETLIARYETHSRFYNVKDEDLAEIVSSLANAAETVSTSQLDEEAKEFFGKRFRELIDLLRDIDFYGFEAAWAKNAELVAGLYRYADSFDNLPDEDRKRLWVTTWESIKFLAVINGATGGLGLRLITTTAQAVLGSTPAY